jgi:CRP-like cAMP-binding protein
MPDLLQRVLLLKQTPAFGGVATEDLRVVARELDEEVFFAGERVFDIHDPADRLYLVARGRIGISILPDPAVAQFIAELGPGECFGEMGLFDDRPRSATAHVLEESALLALEKAKLRHLVLTYPELGLGLLKGLSERLRSTNQRLTPR